jgi:hypothetical protein
MNCLVSIGEAVDKLSILELKLKKINNSDKQAEIKKEIESLSACNKYKSDFEFYYKLLMYVNEQIWDLTDKIKNMAITDTDFSKTSNDIFEYNQKRFRVKNWINLSSTSDIKEQKSYAASYCKIIITTENLIFTKIAEINFLLLEYDLVFFDCSHISTIKKIFKNPTIIYNMDKCPSNVYECDISTFNIPNSIQKTFEFCPITYINGGKLGDFLQSLSVVCETFYNTGKKGIILIANKGDTFKNGIENTYDDTYNIIINQKYIYDYKIYNGENFSIDLTMWRNYERIIANTNWYMIYGIFYNIEWGKHKWINVETNSLLYGNKVFINTTNYRWPDIDFNLIYNKYGNDLVFLNTDFDLQQYSFFVNKTGLNIPYISVSKFSEMCCAIASCKLFIGGLSAPLTIAHAIHKDRIIGLINNAYNEDTIRNCGLDSIWNNVRYSV